MKIHYNSTEEMIEIVKGLVIAGLGFNVIAATWTIELTGGY